MERGGGRRAWRGEREGGGGRERGEETLFERYRYRPSRGQQRAELP